MLIKINLKQCKPHEVFRNINSPGHEVRPWSYHTVDSVYSLRGKAGNHFQLLVIELLSGSRGLVVLSPAWKTTRSEFDSQ